MTEKTLRAELENKGMHRSTYSSRVKRGWSKRRALSEPIREVGWRRHKGRAKPAAKGDGAEKPVLHNQLAIEVSSDSHTFQWSKIQEFIGQLALENLVHREKIQFWKALADSRATEFRELQARTKTH